jgi:hypothetical protein
MQSHASPDPRRVVRNELELLRRMGIDRRKASALLPILQRTGCPASLFAASQLQSRTKEVVR